LNNTSKTSRARLLAQLRKIGFNEECIVEQDIMTSVIAARNFLMDRNLKAYCLTEEAVMEDLKEVDGGDMSDSSRGAVLVGLAPTALRYDRMNAAFRVLVDEKVESELVAIHTSKYFRDGDGMLSLGPGPFVKALEDASGKEAHVVGKPSPTFFEAALSELGCSAGDCVMIGDDIVGDVGGANAVGISTVLVRTGKFLPKDEDNKEIKATCVMDSVVEAVDWIVGEEYDTENEETILKEMDGGEGGNEAPMSPREEKMVKEIQALRSQLKEMGGEPRELFPAEEKVGGEGESGDSKDEKDEGTGTGDKEEGGVTEATEAMEATEEASKGPDTHQDEPKSKV
jgi:HAD superfamily hydrolase (TIGR01458 family)